MENVEKRNELITIPCMSIFRFIVFLGSLALAYYGFRAIVYFWKELGINLSAEAAKNASPLWLVILPWFLGEYFLASLATICMIAWIKKGYKNLKRHKKGFFGGLIGCSIIGLGVFIGMFIGGLSSIVVLIEMFIGGLILVFIGGLTIGLIKEFSKE